MTTTDIYIPKPGDVVTFPGAPMAPNRERHYVIISVHQATWGDTTVVTYRPAWERNWTPTMDYSDSLNTLRELGVTLVTRA